MWSLIGIYKWIRFNHDCNIVILWLICDRDEIVLPHGVFPKSFQRLIESDAELPDPRVDHTEGRRVDGICLIHFGGFLSGFESVERGE